MSKNAEDKKQSVGQSAGQQAFCFCLGELVDCIPGVVLDCNNKRTTKCPLLQEKERSEKPKDTKQSGADQKKPQGRKKEENSKKDNRAFCFCLGSQVDCLPGVVLDCNNKRTTECPLVLDVLSVSAENRNKVEDFKKKYKDKKQKNTGHKQAEAKKQKGEETDRKKKSSEKEENIKKENTPKKDNRAFCFCMGSQVDCLPGVVLDCNNKRTTKCPLVLDVLSVNANMNNQVDDLKKKYLNEEPSAVQKSGNSEKSNKKKKDNRAF